MINVLGIHSSPIKKGNTAWVLDYALKEAEKAEGVKMESISLAGLKIADCNQCNWCMKKQTPEKLFTGLLSFRDRETKHCLIRETS